MSSAQQSPARTPSTGKPFSQMSWSERLTFLAKVCVMLITGGFVFPNIFVE